MGSLDYCYIKKIVAARPLNLFFDICRQLPMLYGIIFLHPLVNLSTKQDDQSALTAIYGIRFYRPVLDEKETSSQLFPSSPFLLPVLPGPRK